MGNSSFRRHGLHFSGPMANQDPVLRAALTADATKVRDTISAGADVNAWDEHGMTPLLSAVFIGNVDAVRLLLEAGADANRAQRDDPTATPLWHAREDFGLHEIAQLLEKAGAK
jgi:ankyrin repeat protein